MSIWLSLNCLDALSQNSLKLLSESAATFFDLPVAADSLRTRVVLWKNVSRINAADIPIFTGRKGHLILRLFFWAPESPEILN
tara:strand:- start:477 stop:725 length:249 start_codon:yes stop_codon:yes gene_type:complete